MSITRGKGPLSEEDHSEIQTDDSPSSSETESDYSDEIPSPEFMESLLEKARASLAEKRRLKEISAGAVQRPPIVDDDVLTLDDDENKHEPLPTLDPGPLVARAYFHAESSGSRTKPPSLVRDPHAEEAERAATSASKVLPAPELSKSGKPLTKREKKELKRATAGPKWFDLPAPDASDLPKLYREVEALRMRNSLDPKRWYRKDDGEGKGIKGLPKYFAIGKVVDTPTPFNASSQDNLGRAERKKTLVEELVADSEAKSSAKRKFEALQGVRGERGRNTLHRKNAAKRQKW